jgi:hypothetical protein
VNDELVALDGLMQIGGQLERSHRGVVHVGGEELPAAGTTRLRGVHGQVGVAQKRGRLIAVA